MESSGAAGESAAFQKLVAENGLIHGWVAGGLDGGDGAIGSGAAGGAGSEGAGRTGAAIGVVGAAVGALTGAGFPEEGAGVGLRGAGETGVHKVARRRARRKDALARFERRTWETRAFLLRRALVLREAGVWRTACWHRTGVRSRAEAAELTGPPAVAATNSRVNATQRDPLAAATL